MQFMCQIRGNDTASLPPAQELALVRETFEQLAAGRDKRIKGVYPFVGERACCLLIDAGSPEELQECLMSLPFFGLTRCETHVVGTPKSLIDSLHIVEQRMANLSPAGSRN